MASTFVPRPAPARHGRPVGEATTKRKRSDASPILTRPYKLALLVELELALKQSDPLT